MTTVVKRKVLSGKEISGIQIFSHFYYLLYKFCLSSPIFIIIDVHGYLLMYKKGRLNKVILYDLHTKHMIRLC